MPRGDAPCAALLAPPGDDVRPEHVRLLVVPPGSGLLIQPGAWHQPVYPLVPTATFDDAQGAVHVCVSVDFPGEFGCYLGVDLTP